MSFSFVHHKNYGFLIQTAKLKKDMKTKVSRAFSLRRHKIDQDNVICVRTLKDVLCKKGIPHTYEQREQLRSRVWKVLLGVLPPNTQEWPDKVSTYCRQYTQFLNDFYYNFDYPKTEILCLLQKDISRIFPDLDFFKNV